MTASGERGRQRRCLNADVIPRSARGSRRRARALGPALHFAAPPTRVIHIDADLAEIGRNLPTELGGIADAKLALAAIAAAGRGLAHRDRGRVRDEIRRGRRAFSEEWAHQWTSDQFPLRPERILSELRQALPEDGFIVTDVGWNKNGVAQQFSITVPGTSSAQRLRQRASERLRCSVKTGQPGPGGGRLVGDGASAPP